MAKKLNIGLQKTAKGVAFRRKSFVRSKEAQFAKIRKGVEQVSPVRFNEVL